MTELEDINKEIIRTETILAAVEIKLKHLKEKKKFIEMMP